MTFTLFDIIILTVITSSSFLGLYRGALQITINLIGFIASIIFAVLSYPYVKTIFSDYLKNDLIGSIASGISAYIISLVIFTFLASKVISLLSGMSLGWFDRVCGFVIGFVRGILIALLIFVITAIFTNGTYSKAELVEELVLKISKEDYPEWLKISTTTPYLEKSAKEIIEVIPKDILHSVELPNSKKAKDGHADSPEEAAVDKGFSEIKDLLPASE
ncbi:MAG: hypothetical protein Tsb006_0700 [Rickettsiaceae bacterium]